MNENNEPLQNLEHIRSMMERSTTVLSLTGLSGVIAGVFGLAAVLVAFWRLGSSAMTPAVVRQLQTDVNLRHEMMILAVVTLAITLAAAAALTVRRARKRGLSVWDGPAHRFMGNLFVPLLAGGAFVLALAHHGQFQLICAALLVFFGLAMITAGKYVRQETFSFGLAEVILGVIGCFWVEAGLVLWGVGFGLLTAGYGTAMYLKYEQ